MPLPCFYLSIYFRIVSEIKYWQFKIRRTVLSAEENNLDKDVQSVQCGIGHTRIR